MKLSKRMERHPCGKGWAREVAQLEAENAALKRENEKLPEYKALASLVCKHRVVYEDNHSGDGIIAFDDTELADAVVNLAEVLLADTQESEVFTATENNKCAEPTDNAEVLHTKDSP